MFYLEETGKSKRSQNLTPLYWQLGVTMGCRWVKLSLFPGISPHTNTTYKD